MCVRSSDLWHTNYEWSCDAGSLTQPQGLNEMTWKAPSTPGTYTITCRASIGGESQVRSHKMYVSSYNFDKFEKTPHSLSLQVREINPITNSFDKKVAPTDIFLFLKKNKNAQDSFNKLFLDIFWS